MMMDPEYKRLAREELARRNLLDFCAWTDEDYDPTLRHAKIICEHLDAMVRREIENLAIFMPPQHGKSYHFSQRFPAFALGVSHGRALIATTSYTIDVARKNSRAARALVAEANYPFHDVRLGLGGADEWYTTAGGGVKAAGVGGSLTGFGANIIGIDDPFKGRAEADSLVIRDNVWVWYQEVVSTRRRRGTQKLLAMTRWHDDDLAGRLLNSVAAKSWTVLNLRSTAEEDDPLHRPLGEILWPGGPEPLSVASGEISSRGYAALYQQRPSPETGTLFQREWFSHRWKTLPAVRRGVIYLDGAWKTGLANDRSALACWVTNGRQYFAVDAWAGRVEYPDLKTKVAAYWDRFKGIAPTMSFCVEDAASGIPIVQELRRSTSIPIIGVPAQRSKFVNAESVTPEFEAGLVLLPESASWLDEWIEEHVAFPTAKHDDWVDTTSGAIGKLRGSRASGASFAIARSH
jgi:predicted phage terminase large subunit-like protein